MGLQRILLWLPGRILSCISMLRQISYWKIPFHLLVRVVTSPFHAQS
jgi:hypothetical protein